MNTTPKDSDPGNILVVDDTPANLQLLSKMLGELGHTVRPVPSGKLALRAARNDPPEVVLLDIMMPEMDGYEVLEQIKSDETLCDIRVIMISALSEADSVVRCIENGADDYLTKPFKPAILEAKINACLERKRLRERQQDLHRQLESSFESLKKAEQARDGLFNMIVHDLNNPLTAIQGYLDLALVDAETDPLDKDTLTLNLQTALGSTATMTALVRGILDVSKMEAGEMPVSLTSVNITDLSRKICDEFQAHAKFAGKGISFESECVKKMAFADEALLSRILQNLLGNALKHTSRGTSIICSVEKNGNDMVIAVKDNGLGIPAELKDKVFEKFFQIEAGEKGKKYGTGLGLAFCKMATEAQNGKIWVEGEEGKGACFKIALKTSEL